MNSKVIKHYHKQQLFYMNDLIFQIHIRLSFMVQYTWFCFSASLYFVNVTNLPTKLNDIEQLIGNVSEILSKDNRQWDKDNEEKVRIESFIPDLNYFLIEKEELFNGNSTQSGDKFLSYITEFLFTSERSREWRRSFIFSTNESLSCGEPSPPILALRFQIQNFLYV